MAHTFIHTHGHQTAQRLKAFSDRMALKRFSARQWKRIENRILRLYNHRPHRRLYCRKCSDDIDTIGAHLEMRKSSCLHSCCWISICSAFGQPGLYNGHMCEHEHVIDDIFARMIYTHRKHVGLGIASIRCTTNYIEHSNSRLGIDTNFRRFCCCCFDSSVFLLAFSLLALSPRVHRSGRNEANFILTLH